MATELYANVATTTVSSGGTTAPAGGTSEAWTVASSTPFPAAATGVSQFHVADPAAPTEIMLVTNVSGTTWTVTRGAESTTPVTHSAGFTIWLVVTSGDLTAMLVAGNNLSDVTSASSARSNLGLGAAAVIGTPVSIANGGTGQASQQAAMDALAGAVTSGDFLRGNATHVTMAAIQAGDLPAGTTSARGALQLDGTASDIQPLGASAGAGATGLAADAEHVHPNTGLVTGVTAGDTSIVVGGTSAAPTIETATLDVIATDHAPAGNWSNNSHKITSLANGSGAQDAAAYGQTIGSLLTTVGDIPYEGTGPVPARLAGNTTAQLQFLGQTGSGSASAAPAWAVVPGQMLCAPKVYAPVSQTNLTVNTTTLAAWSTGNVCTNSFTAPASGKVLVTFSGIISQSVSGDVVMLGLAATGGVTPVIGNTTTYGIPGTTLSAVTVPFYVTGLTPGTSYQFDLLGAATSTTTATLRCIALTSVTLGSSGAPAVMTVVASL